MCHAAPSVHFMAILYSYNRSASEKATSCQLALCEFVNLINAEKYKPYIFLFLYFETQTFFSLRDNTFNKYASHQVFKLKSFIAADME